MTARIPRFLQAILSPRAVPGVATVIAGIVAPYSAWQSLAILGLNNDKVMLVLDDPVARAVINQFFQFSVVFIVSLIPLLTSLAYLISPRVHKGCFRNFLLITSFLCGGVLFALFLSGGAAWVPLNVEPGSFKLPSLFKMFPPFGHPMTLIRYLLVAVGLTLAAWAPRYPLRDPPTPNLP